MRKPAVLLFLFLLVSGCGDSRAPVDAIVTGPEESLFTTKVVSPDDDGTRLFRPGDFQVRNSADVPIPDVEIELFAGGQGILTNTEGVPFNSENPTYLKTKTDSRGMVRASFLAFLDPCGTEDVTVTGSIVATVGVASHLWGVTITSEAC
jgi:hypothetical protein